MPLLEKCKKILQPLNSFSEFPLKGESAVNLSFRIFPSKLGNSNSAQERLIIVGDVKGFLWRKIASSAE